MDNLDFSEKIELLIQEVGLETTLHICDLFAGESVYFPKNYQVFRKHEKIRDEFRQGKSYKQLSKKYKLTTRQIREILYSKKYRKPRTEIQKTLF